MASSLTRLALRVSSALLRAPTLRPSVLAARNSCRTISTTERKKDSAAGLSVHQDGVNTKVAGPEAPVNTDYVRRKDWITTGMHLEDEDIDRWMYQTGCFVVITMMCVCVIYYFTYEPNPCWPNKDWINREAYLELHRREKFGLPQIDPDFIPRANITLPSEDDLEDFEVII